ncbi:MAG: DUF4062 domain-containing protein [Candidatus Bathyarchaeota archaeon]|nr:DUF4062 domain-containing protein [Candidatus Bathyarchaeota archaeon]
MARLRVFVSSAMHELEYEREVASKVIRELDMEPILFEGLPPMSKILQDAYLDEVKNCDFFVLILWQTLREAVEQEYITAVKNNRPILVLVKMLKKNEIREENLSRFIGELERVNNQQASFIPYYKAYRSLDQLSQFLKEGLMQEVERRLYAQTVTTRTREEMYQLGTEIMRSARKRLYIIQRTPSLIFGPRPYHDDRKLRYDVDFASALESWISKVVEGAGRECAYLYSAQSAKDEMEKERMQEQVKQKIKLYKEKERLSGYRFRFSSIPPRYSGPIAVGDNQVAIWIMGEHNAVSISFVNRRVSDELIRILKQMVSKLTTTEDLLQELGLS